MAAAPLSLARVTDVVVWLPHAESGDGCGRGVIGSNGVIDKRCGCRDRDTRQRLEHHCPQLEQGRHRSWPFDCSVHNLIGQSERKRKDGYRIPAAARRGMNDWLTQTRERRTGQGWTLARCLRYWLSTRTRIRPTTRLHYTRDIDLFLIPFLGTIGLANLHYHRLTRGFDRIATSTNGRCRHPPRSTLQHLRTILRTALNLAVRQGILTDNPARRLYIPGVQRAVAQVWTPSGSPNGWPSDNDSLWRSGPSRTWPSSSLPCSPTGCSRCGGWSRYAACGAAKPPACAGPTSTSRTGRCT